MSSGSEHTDVETIPDEVLTELLGSRRRCHVLAELGASGGEALVEDLVAAVGADEEGCAPPDVDDRTLGEIREDVFERHIPKLTATGVVEYDSMLDRLRLEMPEVASRAAGELTDSGGNNVSRER